MNLIHIVPPENVAQITQPYEMYLAHTLIGKPDLQQAIAQKDSFKILDNGAYELDESIKLMDILDIAQNIGADEIILPDHMFDCDKTIQATLNALETIIAAYEKIPFKLMAVIQGKTPEDYDYCLQVFKKIKEISTIGIPKKFLRESNPGISRRVCALERAGYAKWIKEHEIPDKDIHLLGLSWHLMELQYCKNAVRSCDTNLVAEATKTDTSIFEGWHKAGCTSEKYSLERAFTPSEIRRFVINMQVAEDYINGND